MVVNIDKETIEPIFFNCRKWLKVETISIITDSVRDVAFAPNLGRSYHMLAIAAKDVSIITLKPLRSGQYFGYL